MVTALDMRLFALDCVRWSEETRNPSHRDLMLDVAKTWIATAAKIERHIGNYQVKLPDLRSKLN